MDSLILACMPFLGTCLFEDEFILHPHGLYSQPAAFHNAPRGIITPELLFHLLLVVLFLRSDDRKNLFPRFFFWQDLNEDGRG